MSLSVKCFHLSLQVHLKFTGQTDLKYLNLMLNRIMRNSSSKKLSYALSEQTFENMTLNGWIWLRCEKTEMMVM